MNKNNLLINILYGQLIFFLSVSSLFFVAYPLLGYIFASLFFLSIYFLWLVKKSDKLGLSPAEMPAHYKMLTTGVLCASFAAVLYSVAFAADVGKFLKFLLFFISSFCVLIFFASVYLYSKQEGENQKEDKAGRGEDDNERKGQYY